MKSSLSLILLAVFSYLGCHSPHSLGDSENPVFRQGSSSGRVDHGDLLVAKLEFTAPTFTYRFDGERAATDERVRTGRPVLEVRIRSYESANPPEETILLAHFATFAKSTKRLRETKSRV